MSKHHQKNRAHPANRLQQIESSQSPSEVEFVLAYEDIQRRAYQIHEEKGGSDLENWLEAERVLKEEYRRQH